MDAFFRIGASLSDHPAVGNHLMEIGKQLIITEILC
jgi:hypothetical protein